MRVRSGRFNKLARTTKLAGSGSVILSLYPKVFDADQALGFQPRVGQTLLQCWGSGHVPIAVATDAMLDRSFQTDAQGSEIPNLGTRPAPLFPIAHAQAAPKPLVQLRNRLVVLADAKVPHPAPKVLPQFSQSVVRTHPPTAAREPPPPRGSSTTDWLPPLATAQGQAAAGPIPKTPRSPNRQPPHQEPQPAADRS